MTILKGSRYASSKVSVIQNSEGERYTTFPRPMVFPPSTLDTLYVTVSGDTYPIIASRRTIYNDATLYWVIAAANPDPQFFRYMTQGFEEGVALRIPATDTVFGITHGRPARNPV